VDVALGAGLSEIQEKGGKSLLISGSFFKRAISAKRSKKPEKSQPKFLCARE
jgi:hypothetical protein